MYQVETRSLPIEVQRERPRHFRVAISTNHAVPRVPGPEDSEHTRPADIPQMPDFVRPRQPPGQVAREAVVGVGNHGDAHASDVNNPGSGVPEKILIRLAIARNC